MHAEVMEELSMMWPIFTGMADIPGYYNEFIYNNFNVTSSLCHVTLKLKF